MNDNRHFFDLTSRTSPTPFLLVVVWPDQRRWYPSPMGSFPFPTRWVSVIPAIEMRNRFSSIARSVLAPGKFNVNTFQVAIQRPPWSIRFKRWSFLSPGASKGRDGIKEGWSSEAVAKLFVAMGLGWRAASPNDPRPGF